MLVLEVYDVEAIYLNADPGTKMNIKIPDERVKLEFVTNEEQQEHQFCWKTTYTSIKLKINQTVGASLLESEFD